MLLRREVVIVIVVIIILLLHRFQGIQLEHAGIDSLTIIIVIY